MLDGLASNCGGDDMDCVRCGRLLVENEAVCPACGMQQHGYPPQFGYYQPPVGHPSYDPWPDGYTQAPPNAYQGAYANEPVAFPQQCYASQPQSYVQQQSYPQQPYPQGQPFASPGTQVSFAHDPYVQSPQAHPGQMGFYPEPLSPMQASVGQYPAPTQPPAVAAVAPPPVAPGVGEGAAGTAKPAWKNNRMIVLYVALGVMLVMVMLVVLLPRPQHSITLDESVSFEGIAVDYPDSWSTMSADDATTALTYINPPSDYQGLVMLRSAYKEGPIGAGGIEQYLDDADFTSSAEVESMQVDGRPAFKAEGEMLIDGDSYDGFALVIDFPESNVQCFAMIRSSQAGSLLATLEAIVDSARIEPISEELKVVCISNGATVLDETVVNEGQGGFAEAPSGLAMEGYVLDGWKIVEGNAVLVKAGDAYQIKHITTDVKVDAVWVQVWTVTFTDGMGNVLSTEEVRNGASAAEPSRPRREGYEFTGWSADVKSVTSSMTVDAMWERLPTPGERNAVRKAKSYLDYTAFSYAGLIRQLEYEGFTHEEAVYGVDHCGADWNAQALRSAKSYLDYTAFSYTGLIRQLEYEGYTHEQAVYGADSCGADWNEQAAECAKKYLAYSAFSRSRLIEQLEYEGFTHAQAVYGVGQAGL